MTRFDTTPAVDRALEFAQEFARRSRSTHLQANHLLQGLLADEEGRPWTLLTEAGLDPRQVRLSLPPANALTVEEAPLSGTVRQALAQAHDLTESVGAERSITSEILLFALLSADDNLRESLQSRGLNFVELEIAICGEEQPPLRLDEPLRLDQGVDDLATARILDACANRAREALRVLEDYVRFVLNDALLSRELKQLRHDLAAALSVLPEHMLIQSRDTEADVGTTIVTASEMERGDLQDVLQAGCKRLQESLRSLEEYGKLFSADFARQVEAIRYRAYTLEPALLLGINTRARLEAAQLYVLVGSDVCRASLLGTVGEVIAGGAQIIQLREKNVEDRTLLERAREIRAMTRKAGVLFILNDRPDLARIAQADGVHLGQEDLPVRDARRLMGPDALIGVSTHNLPQLRQAILDGASYVGLGPVFPSRTKKFDDLAGLDFVREAAAESSIPAFVLGGIDADNLSAILANGGRRVAVSSAVCQAADPRAAATAILTQLRSNHS